MTFRASASAIEITHPSLDVSGLEVGNVNRAPSPFLCVCLPVMDERNQRRELLIVDIAKRRHSLGKASIPHHHADFCSVHVLLNKCRRRQVRTAFATSSIPSMAEATLRGEQSFTSLYLFDRSGGFSNRFRGSSFLPFTALCVTKSCGKDEQRKHKPVSRSFAHTINKRRNHVGSPK